jgi:hypothetical protein
VSGDSSLRGVQSSLYMFAPVKRMREQWQEATGLHTPQAQQAGSLGCCCGRHIEQARTSRELLGPRRTRSVRCKNLVGGTYVIKNPFLIGSSCTECLVFVSMCTIDPEIYIFFSYTVCTLALIYQALVCLTVIQNQSNMSVTAHSPLNWLQRSLKFTDILMKACELISVGFVQEVLEHSRVFGWGAML